MNINNNLENNFNASQINIVGTNCEVGGALSDHIRDYLMRIINKYQSKFKCTDAKVTYTKNKHHDYFIAETLITFNRGIGTVKSTHKDSNPYMAFNGCYHTVQRLLSRYKDRQSEHKHNPDEFVGATYSVFSDEDFDYENQSFKKNEEQKSPLIVAEYKEKIFHFSVDEAVMHLEMNGLPAMMFVNSNNKKINMVYRRNDGTIGWTDPDYEN